MRSNRVKALMLGMLALLGACGEGEDGAGDAQGAEQAQLAERVRGVWQIEGAQARLANGDLVAVFGPEASCDAFAVDLAVRLQIDGQAGAMWMRSEICEVHEGAVVLPDDGSVSFESDAVAGALVFAGVEGDTLTVTQTMRVAAADGPGCVGGSGTLDEPAAQVELTYVRLDPATMAPVSGCN